MSPYILILISVLLGAVGQIFLKQGMSQFGAGFSVASFLDTNNLLKMVSNKFIVLGFINYGIATVVWLTILTKMDVSKAYPFLSFGYVITAVLAVYYLNESFSSYRWIGIFLMVLGGYFLFKS